MDNQLSLRIEESAPTEPSMFRAWKIMKTQRWVEKISQIMIKRIESIQGIEEETERLEMIGVSILVSNQRLLLSRVSTRLRCSDQQSAGGHCSASIGSTEEVAITPVVQL